MYCLHKELNNLEYILFFKTAGHGFHPQTSARAPNDPEANFPGPTAGISSCTAAKLWQSSLALPPAYFQTSYLVSVVFLVELLQLCRLAGIWLHNGPIGLILTSSTPSVNPMTCGAL